MILIWLLEPTLEQFDSIFDRENKKIKKTIREQQQQIRERNNIHKGWEKMAHLVQKLKERHLVDNEDCYCQLF